MEVFRRGVRAFDPARASRWPAQPSQVIARWPAARLRSGRLRCVSTTGARFAFRVTTTYACARQARNHLGVYRHGGETVPEPFAMNNRQRLPSKSGPADGGSPRQLAANPSLTPAEQEKNVKACATTFSTSPRPTFLRRNSPTRRRSLRHGPGTTSKRTSNSTRRALRSTARRARRRARFRAMSARCQSLRGQSARRLRSGYGSTTDPRASAFATPATASVV